MQRRFSEEIQKLEATSPTPEQRSELLDRHAAELQQFLDKEAAGDDRWNGRLMLTEMQLVRGDRAAAAKVLRSIEPAQAPPLLLVVSSLLSRATA